MNKIIFNKIQDLLIEIKTKNYDRSFANFLGFHFFSEENDDLVYNNLDDYFFFFNFLDVEQVGISDEKFKSIIDKLLLIEKINPTEMKKVLYEDQLKEIENKYERKVISLDIYNKLKNKYLD